MVEVSAVKQPSVIFSAMILVGLLPACVPQSAATKKQESRQRKMFGLVEKFDRFDYNGDGYLTRTELNELIKVQKVPDMTPEKLDKAMRAYDTNNDNRISLVEAQKGAHLGPQIFDEA